MRAHTFPFVTSQTGTLVSWRRIQYIMCQRTVVVWSVVTCFIILLPAHLRRCRSHLSTPFFGGPIAERPGRNCKRGGEQRRGRRRKKTSPDRRERRGSFFLLYQSAKNSPCESCQENTRLCCSRYRRTDNFPSSRLRVPHHECAIMIETGWKNFALC